MTKTFKALAALCSIAISSWVSVSPALADFGDPVVDVKGAIFESLATQVTASKVMNTAEEVKISKPTSDAAAILQINLLDDKGDNAQQKASDAFDKTQLYLSLAQATDSPDDKAAYTTAADNYEKTAYYYSVAADLYLAAQQKVQALAVKLPASKTSADLSDKATVKSLADAQKAVTEAKAEVSIQKNVLQSVAEASQIDTTLGTSASASDAKSTVEELAAVAEDQAADFAMLSDAYKAKAAKSTGATKVAYKLAADTYKSAESIATQAVQSSVGVANKFANAVPENPTEPDPNLKWHIFQNDPDTAVMVMRYYFAQFNIVLATSEARAQTIAQDPDAYLAQRMEVDGMNQAAVVTYWRTVTQQNADEAKALRVLISQYNDKIPTAVEADVQKWKDAASYLSDIVVIFDAQTHLFYQTYAGLSADMNKAPVAITTVTKNADVNAVLKAGVKKVATQAEFQPVVFEGTTNLVAYTTAPETKVTYVASKAGSPTITKTDVSDQSGLAQVLIPNDLTGYTVKVLIAGKTLDTEVVNS